MLTLTALTPFELCFEERRHGPLGLPDPERKNRLGNETSYQQGPQREIGGDPILICAVDDIGFTSVDVELVAANDSPIEKGSAVETAARSGNWIYSPTAPVASGSDIFIKVMGFDYTGKKALLNENPVIGEQD